VLQEFFSISKESYFSILPTATPYARNALFSGSYPSDLELRFPELWEKSEDDESSRNRYERQFLEKLLERRKIVLKPELIVRASCGPVQEAVRTGPRTRGAVSRQERIRG